MSSLSPTFASIFDLQPVLNCHSVMEKIDYAAFHVIVVVVIVIDVVVEVVVDVVVEVVVDVVVVVVVDVVVDVCVVVVVNSHLSSATDLRL